MGSYSLCDRDKSFSLGIEQMKSPLKRILVVLVCVLLFATLFSLLIPSHVAVTRATNINASASKIQQELSDLSKWKNWYPPIKNDPSVNLGSANDNGHPVLIITRKDGKEMQLSLLSTDSGSIKVQLDIKDENPVTYDFLIDNINGQPRVVLHAGTVLKWYPWEKVYGMFLDKLTGPAYETALQNLKEYLESEL